MEKKRYCAIYININTNVYYDLKETSIRDESVIYLWTRRNNNNI